MPNNPRNIKSGAHASIREPTVVDIPGVGEVEFPASMAAPEIDAAAKRLYERARQEAQPPAVSRFASNLWEQVNPVEGVKGLAQAVRHPVETAKTLGQAQGALLEEGGEAIGEGDVPEGIMKLAAYLVPILGPMLAKAGTQMAEGDIAGGLGTTAGVAANVVGPKLAGAATKGFRGNVAGKLYESALKPSTTIPVAKRATMIETGLAERIPVSQTGLQKIGSLIDDLNEKIALEIDKAGPGRTVSPDRAVKATREVEAKFSQQVNPKADVEAIGASREEFLDQLRESPGSAVRNMTAAEAQGIKRGTYRQLKGRAYGELKRAEIEAQKALARGIKEELVEQFPELKALNAREGKLIELEIAIQKAVSRSANRDIVGIGTPLYGGAVGALTGSRTAAGIAGVLREVIRHPAVSTKLAISLTKGTRGSLAVSRSRIAGYANSLGQAADDAASRPPGDQTNR